MFTSLNSQNMRLTKFAKLTFQPVLINCKETVWISFVIGGCPGFNFYVFLNSFNILLVVKCFVTSSNLSSQSVIFGLFLLIVVVSLRHHQSFDHFFSVIRFDVLFRSVSLSSVWLIRYISFQF